MSTPQRLQRRRTKGWITPLDANGQAARYVGRGSRFGNPARLVHASHGLVVDWPGGGTVGTWPNEADARKFATDLFEHWINEPEQAELRSLARSLLAGRDLLCWCPLPEPGQPDYCHARVLLDLANPTTGDPR